MKVKVTSTGITQKGTSSHLNSTRYHVSTVTSIPSESPCTIAISRVPNKPVPTSTSTRSHASRSHSNSDRRGSNSEHVENNKSRESTNLLRDTKSTSHNAVTSSSSSASKITTVHVSTPSTSSSSNTIVNSKVKNLNGKSSPATQAIRIAIDKRTQQQKQEAKPSASVSTNRKEVSIKKEHTTNTSSTKEIKQVFVKHTVTPPAKPRSVTTTKRPQTQSTTASSSKKSVTVVAQSQPAMCKSSRSVSKPVTVKRKSVSPTHSNPPKVAKLSNKGKSGKVSDIVHPTSGNEDNTENKVTTNALPAVPVPTPIPEPPPIPPVVKKKRSNKTWKLTTIKHTLSVIVIYSNTSGNITATDATGVRNIEMPISRTGRALLREHAMSPVAGEIKDLLYAFGDSSDPLLGTVQLVEEILVHEVSGFIRVCEQKAMIRESKTLGILEAIVTLKRNIPRIDRLYKHFGFKDIYDRQVLRLTQAPEKAKKQLVTKYIQWIIKEFNLISLFHILKVGLDEIESSLQGIEDSKLEEAVRSSPEMLKFYQYAKTRSLSFARKLSTVNLRKLIITSCHVHAKMTDTFGAVLDFFILDIMAQLVDAAFDVRKERLVSSNTDTRVANPDTCMSAPFFLKKRKDDRCNQVSEILVQASEMEATRLKKDQQKKVERHGVETIPSSNPSIILYPSYVREAYMRIQLDTCRPSPSFPGQAYVNAAFF